MFQLTTCINRFQQFSRFQGKMVKAPNKVMMKKIFEE